MNNILIITPGFLPLLGGMEEQVYLLGKEFIKTGNRVTVLTEKTKATFPGQEIYEGINVKRVAIIFNRAFSLPIIFLSYVNFLIKNKYELIIVRTFTFPAIITGLLKRLRLISSKIVVTAETGGEFDDIESISKLPFSKLIYFIIKGNDYFNCISEDNYRHLIKHKFPKEKITRVYNGIDLTSYAQSRFPSKISNFLFLGQLKKEKGVWELMEGFKNSRTNATLFIGGEGHEKKEMEKYIIKNNLKKKIILLGRVSKEDKDSFFSKGEVLILPSYSEGFGLVIFEAAAHKKYIITTDVADIKKIFGENVYFCKKKDPESIRKIIEYLLENKPKVSDYDNIKSICDIKNTANQFLSLIS